MPDVAALPQVPLPDRPDELKTAMDLIAAGGPFPYAQDGSVFRNREGLLPLQPEGYYREYTVETPEAPDRGPRRVMVGDGGDSYYSDDQYRSFREIIDL